MSSLKLSDLKDKFTIVSHPGGSSAPMCGRLGALYRETRSDEELVDIPDAEIYAILRPHTSVPNPVVQILRTRAAIKMTRRVQANGLIYSGTHPFHGLWANSMGTGRFLLGRENQNRSTGPVHSYFPRDSFCPDLEAWLEWRRILTTESVSVSTLEL